MLLSIRKERFVISAQCFGCQREEIQISVGQRRE